MKNKKNYHTYEFLILIKRDFYNALWMNRYKFFLCGLLFLSFCFYFKISFDSMVSLGEVTSNASFSDIILFIFHGMKIYIPAQGMKFEIPITWLGIQILIAYLTGNYINQDITTYGQQYIIRSTKKSYWLFGKLVYCTTNVIILYFIGYVVVMIYSMLQGSFSSGFHWDVCANVSEVNILVLNKADLFLGIVVLPILTSCVLSVAQTILTLWIKPIFSVISIVTYICASAYYFSYFFIGNYSMIARSKKVIESNPFYTCIGIEPVLAVFIELVLLVLLYLSGIITLKKYDYINRT